MPRPDPRRWIDLHMHSTASDGAFAPAKLMELAKLRGLSAVALTDHDTTAGLAEAAAKAGEIGLDFVPAIELAAERSRGVLHILGYFVDADAPGLKTFLADIVAKRDERNRAILERLAAMGTSIDPAFLTATPGTTIGRPHIAEALVRAGAASSFHDAFTRYLARGAAAFVERRTAEAEEVIAVIRAARGVASMAHPSQLRCESHLELVTVLHRLREAGLAALEVRHPDHSADQTRVYTELAFRLSLACSGGTDFHSLGARLDRGVGFGKVRVPYEWLDELRNRRSAASNAARPRAD